MSSSEVLHTARGDFEAIVAGPQDGPPVVLLHGFPELNVSWRHQIPALAAAGYRVIAPNQRGYAGSVRGGSYRAVDLAHDVAAMLDDQGIDRAVVVGHDWGGGVAWTFAQHHPERTKALIVMNCPPPSVLARHLVSSPRQAAKSWYMFFFQLPVLPERFVAKGMPGMLVGGSYDRSAWNRESLAPYAEAFASPSDARGPIDWYRAAFRGALRGALRDVLPGRSRDSRRVTAPVLILWGTHDRFLGQEMVGPESLRGVLDYGVQAEVVPIDTAGHYVQNEAPEAVNAALLDWLERHG